MADSTNYADLDDKLDDDLDSEVLEFRPKNRRGEPSFGLILKQMAEFQMQQALSTQQAQAALNVSIQKSAEMSIQMKNDLAEHLDTRFAELVQAQQSAVPAPLGLAEQLIQGGVEAIQLWLTMMKKNFDEG